MKGDCTQKALLNAFSPSKLSCIERIFIGFWRFSLGKNENKKIIAKNQGKHLLYRVAPSLYSIPFLFYIFSTSMCGGNKLKTYCLNKVY